MVYTCDRLGKVGWDTCGRLGKVGWVTFDRLGKVGWVTCDRLGKVGWVTCDRLGRVGWVTCDRLARVEVHSRDYKNDFCNTILPCTKHEHIKMKWRFQHSSHVYLSNLCTNA